jgi:hypothetical protein
MHSSWLRWLLSAATLGIAVGCGTGPAVETPTSIPPFQASAWKARISDPGVKRTRVSRREPPPSLQLPPAP